MGPLVLLDEKLDEERCRIHLPRRVAEIGGDRQDLRGESVAVIQLPSPIA